MRVDIPPALRNDYMVYRDQYQHELINLYMDLLERGRLVFGSAFLQCGTLRAFENFVYVHTQPGALVEVGSATEAQL